MRSQSISILSANIRGFMTNVGDLTHSFVNTHRPDVVVVLETFLDDRTPENFATIAGYTSWLRRDRQGQGGGVAVCTSKSVYAQHIDVVIPGHLEIMFFKVCLNPGTSILLCAMYRPQWQGASPITFLMDNLDSLLMQHNCQHIIIVGDLNQYLIQRDFDELLAVFNLENFVSFPTHISGSSLDPVVTDLPANIVNCRPLGYVGSSDHQAVFTTLAIPTDRGEESVRTTWLWDRGNWPALRSELEVTDWHALLQGDVNSQVNAFTSHILDLQYRHIPHRQYVTKPTDQPWFGYRCRMAAEAKNKAWRRFKRHPSAHNRNIHRQSCRIMKEVQKWAISRWESETRRKLASGRVGSKVWWSLVKDRQGYSSEDTIPPLNREDGTVATSNQEKADLLIRGRGESDVIVETKEILTSKKPSKSHVKSYRWPYGPPHLPSKTEQNKRASYGDGVSSRLQVFIEQPENSLCSTTERTSTRHRR
nr:uncharacterized protein LOC123761179 [Procambarus clarkii]